MKSPRVVRLSRLPKALVALFGLCSGWYFAGVADAQAQLKVAVVDVSKVFKGYYKTKDVNAKISEAHEAAKQEYDNRMETHHRLLEDIARLDKDIGNPALSASAKADNQRKREDKVQETRSFEQKLQDFKTEREKQIQEQTIRLRTQIVEDILVVVNERVARDHYDLILNKSAQGLVARPIVLHANDELEITDAVIAELNKNRPTAAGVKAPGDLDTPAQ